MIHFGLQLGHAVDHLATLALFDLVELGESAFLAAVFLLQLGYSGGGGFQLNLQHRDRRLLLGKVARDDKRQNF